MPQHKHTRIEKRFFSAFAAAMQKVEAARVAENAHAASPEKEGAAGAEGKTPAAVGPCASTTVGGERKSFGITAPPVTSASFCSTSHSGRRCPRA